MIKEAISKIIQGQDLNQDEASDAMADIMEGNATPAQIGSFITALRMKGETISEITGIAVAMRHKSAKVSTPGFLIDTCGTGGDNKGTINISTAAALVTSASGVKIAKHGNRAVSSTCGSADILEALGVKIDLSPDGVKECIDTIGFGFMLAPIFHPAMKHAAGPRKELGIRTIFNIVGPLTNPANAKAQILGVADRVVAEKLPVVLDRLGVQHAMVVYGTDGMDEFSISRPSEVWELNNGTIQSYTITPEDAGLPRSHIDNIKGGSLKENVAIITAALHGSLGPAQDVILLNTAAALIVGNKVTNFKEGVSLAKEIIASGAAERQLTALASLSQTLT